MPNPNGPSGSRGPRGRTGLRGPKGDVGAWPAEAFDLLMARLEALQEQLDDVKGRLAELEEATLHRQRQRVRPG